MIMKWYSGSQSSEAAETAVENTGGNARAIVGGTGRADCAAQGPTAGESIQLSLNLGSNIRWLRLDIIFLLVPRWSSSYDVLKEIKARTALESKYVKKEAQVAVAMTQKKTMLQTKVGSSTLLLPHPFSWRSRSWMCTPMS